jgi:hypothetical protein
MLGAYRGPIGGCIEKARIRERGPLHDFDLSYITT